MMFVYGVLVTISGALFALAVRAENVLAIAGWSICLITYGILIFKKLFEDFR